MFTLHHEMAGPSWVTHGKRHRGLHLREQEKGAPFDFSIAIHKSQLANPQPALSAGFHLDLWVKSHAGDIPEFHPGFRHHLGNESWFLMVLGLAEPICLVPFSLVSNLFFIPKKCLATSRNQHLSILSIIFHRNTHNNYHLAI